MALTDYDKKNLSSADQQKIVNATNKWNEANKKGDKAGMAAAAAEAASVRNNAGYKTDASGNYSGAYSPTSGGTSSKGNSPTTTYKYTIGSDKGKNIAQNMPIGGTYTAADGSIWTKEMDGTVTVKGKNGNVTQNAYTPTDWGVAINQMISAGVPAEYVEAALANRLEKAKADPNLYQYAYDGIYDAARDYIYKDKTETNQENAQNDVAQWLEDYMSSNAMPGYKDKYNPQIDALLNEILTRDDFSYDASKDPMYQQYAQMYQREGDRAMRDTLAEVASGAGGMNSYAVTAAQQAANYYNSQLGDKIPELYQLAYSMYLDDKESKVQDLGILQNMSNNQYARYRDTMSDWRDDRNFAYGLYQDAQAQGNWQNTFDYNAMVDSRNFGYGSLWDERNFSNNNMWADKEFNANQDQLKIENERYDREQAREIVQMQISLGVMPSNETILAAGYTQAEVQAMVNEVKKDKSFEQSLASQKVQNSAKSKTDDGYDTSDYECANTYDDDYVTVDGTKMTWAELAQAVDDGDVIEIIDHEQGLIIYKKA